MNNRHRMVAARHFHIYLLLAIWQGDFFFFTVTIKANKNMSVSTKCSIKYTCFSLAVSRSILLSVTKKTECKTEPHIKSPRLHLSRSLADICSKPLYLYFLPWVVVMLSFNPKEIFWHHFVLWAADQLRPSGIIGMDQVSSLSVGMEQGLVDIIIMWLSRGWRKSQRQGKFLGINATATELEWVWI